MGGAGGLRGPCGRASVRARQQRVASPASSAYTPPTPVLERLVLLPSRLPPKPVSPWETALLHLGCLCFLGYRIPPNGVSRAVSPRLNTRPGVQAGLTWFSAVSSGFIIFICVCFNTRKRAHAGSLCCFFFSSSEVEALRLVCQGASHTVSRYLHRRACLRTCLACSD